MAAPAATPPPPMRSEVVAITQEVIAFRIVIFAVTFVVLCIIGFLLGSILPNVLDDSDLSSDIATNFYSPGDSRLISFSSFFCDGVNVEVDSVATGATVYIVDAPPPLTEQNNFTVTNRTTLDASNFHFWQYYLYPNSNISISVCSGRRLDVYVIKGILMLTTGEAHLESNRQNFLTKLSQHARGNKLLPMQLKSRMSTLLFFTILYPGHKLLTLCLYHLSDLNTPHPASVSPALL